MTVSGCTGKRCLTPGKACFTEKISIPGREGGQTDPGGNIAIRTSADVDPLVGLAGVKALLALKGKYAGLVDIQVAAFAQEGMEKYPETVELLRQALQLGADLVGGHTIIDADGRGHIDTILDLAREFDVEAEFHLDESGNREHYLLPYLAQRMIELGLQGRVTGIHCCTLSALTPGERQEALELIKESSLKVISAPTAISTRALAPVKELLQLGCWLASVPTM